MKTITYKKTVTKPILEITYDGCADSPREWSSLGYFITAERNYNSPDKEASLEYAVKTMGESANSCDEHMELIKEYLASDETSFSEEVIYIVPVSKFEHSGVIYRRGEEHGWDSGVCGFYIVTKESAERLGTPSDRFQKVIDEELKVYTQYANGDVYAFVLFDEEGKVKDSCGGFYDINDIKEYLPEEWKDEDLSEYMK